MLVVMMIITLTILLVLLLLILFNLVSKLLYLIYGSIYVFDMELHIRSCRMNEFGCFLLPTWPFSVLFVNPKTINNKKQTNKFPLSISA